MLERAMLRRMFSNVPRCLLLCLACWSLDVRSMALGDAQEGSIDLTGVVEVLEDPSGRLTIDEVRQPALAARFQPPAPNRRELNFGFTASAYWLRLSLRQAPGQTEDWLLEIPYALIDELAFYAPGAAPVLTGDAHPLNSRPYFHGFFVFALALGPDTQHYYLRVASKNPLTVPLRAWPDRLFGMQVHQVLSLQFLYTGGLLVLMIYNLFVFFMIRDWRFLFYALYALFFGLGMLAGNGLGHLFLWPEATAFNAIAESLLLSLAGAFLMLFSGSFLQEKHRRSWPGPAWQFMAGLLVLIALLLGLSLYLPLPVQQLHMALMLSAVAGIVLLVSGLLRAWRHRRTDLRIFTLAWAMLSVGIFVAIGRAFDWLPTNPWTSYSLQISSVFEMLLLALALADLLRTERHQREQAQLREMDARQHLLENLQTANERLELTVQQRTEQLQSTLQHEKEMLVQYRRFGAMISHEFRNPLSIINSQLSLMRKEHECGELLLDKRLSVLDSATRRLVLMFDKWLQSDRLNHALEDIDPHPIPLTEWLEHFVQTNVHSMNGCPLELRWQARVPQLVGDEYLLDIALGNLVDNARKYAGREAPVVIETRVKPGFVGLAVIDQGPGIAPEHQQAVFGEYFRISPQSGASGMGLGLSIVRRIAEKHGGQLELDSVVGQGCCFSLWLPAKS